MNVKLIAILLLCAASQGAIAQITISPEIGLNMSNYRVKQEYSLANNLAKLSPRAGVAVGLRLSEKVGIESGVFYEQNGFKNESYGNTQDMNIHCVQIPLGIQFTPDTRTKHLSFGFGGYATWHVKGYTKFNGKDEELKFAYNTGGSQYYVSKPMDFGWRISSTLALSEKVYVKAHFQMSALNLFFQSAAPDSYFDVRNYNCGISLGYNLFSWKKHKKKLID